LTLSNKERLRVYPFGGINELAFGSKDGRALFEALQSCMESMVSLSSICCLVNSAEIQGQKKHAQVLLTVPRHSAGSKKIDTGQGEAREKFRN